MSQVVITGGASGIGRATAEVPPRRGAFGGAVGPQLPRWSTSPTPELRRGRRRLRGRVAVDVTDPTAVAAAVSRSPVEALGGVDGFVHAAGGQPDPLGSLTDENWRRVVDVNLTAFRSSSRRCWNRCGSRRLLPRSRGADRPAPGWSVSSRSRAWSATPPSPLLRIEVRAPQVTRAWRTSSGGGIRVNAVCPGFVETPMLQIALDVPGLREEMEAEAPLGRLARPDEIGHAVAFLLSERAGFITGTHLVVDGGATAVL